MTSQRQNVARREKNDEWYTDMGDICEELKHYASRGLFKDKVVYLNCDDADKSEFWAYFVMRYEELELRGLVATCYSQNDNGKRWTHGHGAGTQVTDLKGDGSFDSPECLAELRGADVVVTNPPFSVFNRFFETLVEAGVEFIVMGNQTAAEQNAVFKELKARRVWYGVNCAGAKWFTVPNDYPIVNDARHRERNGKKQIALGHVLWYTNLDHGRHPLPMDPQAKYKESEYKTFDDYPAIEVVPYSRMPRDYWDLMGVAVSALWRLNRDEFEFIGRDGDVLRKQGIRKGRFTVDGKTRNARIIVRRRKT